MSAGLTSWLRPRPQTPRAGRPKTLRLEALEDRAVPATGLYFDDFVGSFAVDAAQNQYVHYSRLHGTADLDPSPDRTYSVTGTDLTTFSDVAGSYLVKYSPDREVLWVQQGLKIGDVQVAPDATGVERLYLSGLDITERDLDGNVIWSRALPQGATISKFAVDIDGSVYGLGQAPQGADFDPDVVRPDGSDIMPTPGGFCVIKVAADGAFQWVRTVSATATAADPSPYVWTGDIAVAGGVVYVGGYYRGTLSLGALTNQRIDSASTRPDGFLAAYLTDGTYRSVAQFVDAGVTGVRATAAGDVYLTADFGYTADLDPGPGQRLLAPNEINGSNLAVARLTYTDGTAVPTWGLNWAHKLNGGRNSGVGPSRGLAVSGGDLYVSGYFSGTTDFDPGTGAYTLTSSSGTDIFAMRLTTAGTFVWAAQVGSTLSVAVGPLEEGAGVVVAAGGVYLGGVVSHGPVRFVAPGGATSQLLDAGLDRDAFVAKLGTDGSHQWSFAVGAVGRTIDNGDTGYAESGGGWAASTVGFQGDSRTHAKGTGTGKATWTFTNLPNGTYQVVTQFTANTANATNAPFRVNGRPVAVDQRTAPNDITFAFLERVWESLGTATVTDGRLTVELTDAANGTVVADVVRIWFLSESTSLPNRAPVASDDTAVTTAGTPVTIAVLSNDYDLDGDPIRVSAVLPPPVGSVTVNANGTLTYLPPDSTFTGTVTFWYTIDDGRGGTSTASVTITVQAGKGKPK